MIRLEPLGPPSADTRVVDTRLACRTELAGGVELASAERSSPGEEFRVPELLALGVSLGAAMNAVVGLVQPPLTVA